MDKVAYCCSWYAMQVELTNLLDAVQQTETKMVEMSALNHLMSTHVLQQAQQIEQLYDQVTRYMIYVVPYIGLVYYLLPKICL